MEQLDQGGRRSFPINSIATGCGLFLGEQGLRVRELSMSSDDILKQAAKYVLANILTRYCWVHIAG